MRPDPKPEKRTKEVNKCRVNGCFKEADENGICSKCRVKINKSFKREKKSIKRESSGTWAKALRRAKAAFQKLRRLEEADDKGICLCVNGEYRHWTKCQGGHYIPAKNLSTCFERMNVHPQTGIKNRDMDNPIVAGEYTQYMIDRYGEKAVQELYVRSKQTKKYTADELNLMAQAWELKIEKLKKIK